MNAGSVCLLRGDGRPENQKTFDDYILKIHLPDVAAWPRLRRLRLLKNY
jgi:hypothetical protein